jgi:hypothetical protein
LYEDKYDETMVVKAGATIMIPVTVTGYPTPTTKWYHGDQELRATNGITIEIAETHNTLTVKGVSAKNAGTYRVEAENKVGSDSAEFTVKIKGSLIII